MKKLYVLLVLLSIFNLSYTQNFKAKITYQAILDNFDYYNRVINDTTITEFSRNTKLENIQSTKPMNFILLINGDEALYQSELSLVEQKKTGLGYNRTGSVARDDNTYYTNLRTNELYYQSFFTQEVLVNMGKTNWTLTKETKKIGEYTCYKANAIVETEQLEGMHFLSPVEAWYTTEIPTSFGIQNFRDYQA